MMRRRLEQALAREQIARISDQLARMLEDVATHPALGPAVAAAVRRQLDELRRKLLDEAPYAADLLQAEGWPARRVTHH